MPTPTSAPSAAHEDDSFDLEHPAEFSAETLARGTRYATDAERASLIQQLAALQTA